MSDLITGAVIVALLAAGIVFLVRRNSRGRRGGDRGQGPDRREQD